MKSSTIILGLTVILGLPMALMAQVKSPKGKAEMIRKGVEITVDYSRPYKKGREIFGGLVPFDKYWRTGANLATEISFSEDVNFGDKKIKKGRYRMYTIPGRENWEVALNSELGKKGFYEPNYDLDVLHTTVSSAQMDEELEQFTIELTKSKSGVDLIMKWDKTKVVVPIDLLK